MTEGRNAQGRLRPELRHAIPGPLTPPLPRPRSRPRRLPRANRHRSRRRPPRNLVRLHPRPATPIRTFDSQNSRIELLRSPARTLGRMPIQIRRRIPRIPLHRPSDFFRWHRSPRRHHRHSLKSPRLIFAEGSSDLASRFAWARSKDEIFKNPGQGWMNIGRLWKRRTRSRGSPRSQARRRSRFTTSAMLLSWKRRMAAMPAAPASRQERAFVNVIPPRAKTGMLTSHAR